MLACKQLQPVIQRLNDKFVSKNTLIVVSQKNFQSAGLFCAANKFIRQHIGRAVFVSAAL